MGLGSGGVKLNLELWQRGILKDVKSVVEMGYQELALSRLHFEKLVTSAGLENYDSSNFPNLDNWPHKRPRCPTQPFYQMLGIEEYFSVDLNQEHGALAIDLNTPLTDTSVYGKFDLVTDYGTNEHVFNVAEAYRTMHRLCSLNGLMVIFQQLYGGNGYHNFDVSYFEGMAAANQYKILYSSFIVNVENDQIHIPASRELLDMFEWPKTRFGPYIGTCHVMQKQSEEDFKYAYQDSYMAHVQGNAGYEMQFLPNPPSYSYVPMAASLEAVGWRQLASALSSRITNKIKRVVKLR